MLRSMTGFGRCLVENSGMTQQWEVKSVNGRHLETKWHLPLLVRALEPRLEKIVRSHAARGRVGVSLSLSFSAGTGPCATLDAGQASAMLDGLKALAAARGDAYTPDYGALLSVPDLWQDSGDDLAEDLFDQLQEGLTLALDDWNEARTTEARALRDDLLTRLLLMEEWTDRIMQSAPDIKAERIAALRERVGDLLEQNGVALDENRILQEIVILADKLDVSEELTRLSTHLTRLRDLLQSGEDAGRRLDFTLQECFREINTCGNKVSDVHISRIVVDFKNELEKCREQVQNIE